MSRRPIFALLALSTLLVILVLGVLGHVSGHTYTFGGKLVHFTAKGYPEIRDVDATASAAADESAESAAPAGGGGAAGAGAEASANDGSAASDDASSAEAGGESAGEAAAGEPDAAATAGAAVGGVGAPGDAAGEGAPDVAAATPAIPTFRADGLPPGGTCGSAGCHEHDSQHEEWLGSVHHAHQVECVDCHGGVDTVLPEIASEWKEEFEKAFTDDEERQAFFAHVGVHLDRRGKVSAPAARIMTELCGECHGGVQDVFSKLHYDEPPNDARKMSCIKCHSNHAVEATSSSTYESGYTDPTDPRTAPFLKVREHFAELDARIAAAKTEIANLFAAYGQDVEDIDKHDVKLFDPGALLTRLRAIETAAADSRYLVHSLDPELVAAETEGLAGDLATIEKSVGAKLVEIEGRPKVAIFVWAGVILLNLLIAWRLLQLGKPRGPQAPATGDDSAAVGTEQAGEAATSTVAESPPTASAASVVTAAGVGAAVATAVAPARGDDERSVADVLAIATLPDELFEVDEDEDEELQSNDPPPVETPPVIEVLPPAADPIAARTVTPEIIDPPPPAEPRAAEIVGVEPEVTDVPPPLLERPAAGAPQSIADRLQLVELPDELFEIDEDD